MCDVGIALAIGTTMLGAASAVQQGEASASASRYSAQVADMNANLADRRARDAIERGQQEEQRKRMEVSRIKGAQTAAMAANGVDVSFGSPLDVAIDTATLGELDALTIRTNAYRESYDYEVDAANKRAGATLERAKANNASTGGYLKAAGTILGGAGDMYKDYKYGRYRSSLIV